MSTIAATELKQRCLAILDRVGPEGVVITKHGEPVAKLVPVEAGSISDLDFAADPADELIAATSVVHEIPLVTRDERIRRSRIAPLAS